MQLLLVKEEGPLGPRAAGALGAQGRERSTPPGGGLGKRVRKTTREAASQGGARRGAGAAGGGGVPWAGPGL